MLGIAAVLLSSMSVQMMAGPRIYYAMAKDGLIFHALSKVHPRFGTLFVSISVQMLFTLFYVFTGGATEIHEPDHGKNRFRLSHFDMRSMPLESQ